MGGEVMSAAVGYLIPTRESVMVGRPAAKPLIGLAERAEQLGFDSVWVGDSLLARPRHEPLTLLAGIAGGDSQKYLSGALPRDTRPASANHDEYPALIANVERNTLNIAAPER